MASVVFDIETVGVEWESLDDAQRTYLQKNVRTEEERLRLPELLSLWPLTGRIVVLAMVNPDTRRGRVWYEKTDGRHEEASSDGLFKFIGDTEPVFLAEFWKAIARFHRFVTFNGRCFDGPFVMLRSALLGIAAFVLYAIFGVIVLRTDWPLATLGRVAQGLWNRVTRGHRPPVTGLDQRLLAERDTIRAVLGKNWRQAAVLTAGRLGFDYGCLLAALRATGASPQPSLVLLAYAAAGIVALFPLTPGGLGIVEASLSGLLILAGVRAGYAVLAILAYRIASYWLPLLAGPPAYLLFRHRYGRPAPRRATPGEAGSTA